MKAAETDDEGCSLNTHQRLRRHQAESRFFNPRRSKKPIPLQALTGAIIAQRTTLTSKEPINLNETSARRVITAEKAFQDTTVDLPNLGIPRVTVKPWYWNGYSGETGYGPMEYYQTGTTIVISQHRTSPKPQRLGDSFLPQLGTYTKEIYPFLNQLTRDDIENEKQLATLMIRYGKTHQPITLAEIRAIHPAATERDVDKLMQICFLILGKEQGQWLSATEEAYQLGMSVSQARCFLLIEAGVLRFEDVFKNNALLGVYAQTGIIENPDKVSNACNRIDKQYLAYLQQQNTTLRKYDERIVSQGVLTKKQAYFDLKAVYDSDSGESSGYETDLSM